MTATKPDIVVSQCEENNATAGLVATISKEEIDDNRRISQDKQFQDSPEGIEMMREHYFDMINPERLQTSAPLEEEYKRDQIQKANDFLVADGFHLIERGNFAGLLPFGK